MKHYCCPKKALFCPKSPKKCVYCVIFQDSVCCCLKFSSKSKLFGEGPLCLRTTSATLWPSKSFFIPLCGGQAQQLNRRWKGWSEKNLGDWQQLSLEQSPILRIVVLQQVDDTSSPKLYLYRGEEDLRDWRELIWDFEIGATCCQHLLATLWLILWSAFLIIFNRSADAC